jgi:hypothetical protein
MPQEDDREQRARNTVFAGVRRLSDTCSWVTVEDGRAVTLEGDAEHPSRGVRTR